jgi:transposase
MGNMKAYSEDLRQKIVQVLQRGISKSQAARLFNVSLSSVKRYARIAQQGESLKPGKGSGRPPKVGEDEERFLKEDVRERPTATIRERRLLLESLTAKTFSDPTIRRLLKRMGFSQKNGQWGRWSETSG